jgi:hypothetical protein
MLLTYRFLQGPRTNYQFDPSVRYVDYPNSMELYHVSGTLSLVTQN